MLTMILSKKVSDMALIVGTMTIGSVEITEKNDYPTITKEQKKAADPSYSEAVVPAEIKEIPEGPAFLPASSHGTGGDDVDRTGGFGWFALHVICSVVSIGI